MWPTTARRRPETQQLPMLVAKADVPMQCGPSDEGLPQEWRPRLASCIQHWHCSCGILHGTSLHCTGQLRLAPACTEVLKPDQQALQAQAWFNSSGKEGEEASRAVFLLERLRPSVAQ